MQLTNNPEQNIQAVIKIAKDMCANPIIADLTAAQAILEAGLTGTPSYLARRYNNLFGIKGEGTNGSVNMTTHEFYNGQMHIVIQPFAYYRTLQDSFQAHEQLLMLPRYQNVQHATTFEEAAYMIQQDGYATDPNYSDKLISVYNNYIKSN